MRNGKGSLRSSPRRIRQSALPILRLLPGDASLEQAQQFIEEMTGEKMTPEEIDELRQAWQDDAPKS